MTTQIQETETEAQNATATQSGISGKLILASLPQALRKLNPATMVRTPVMFIVEIGAAITFVLGVIHPSLFTFTLAIWLFLTVVFANLAEAVAEGRGKAQADALRKTQTASTGRVRRPNGEVEEVPSSSLRPGDVVIVSAGETIPGDGDVIVGAATVDESAVTGESAPVIRESGGDRSAVTGGTRVLSDTIEVRITSEPGNTFIDRMIGLVEGASRQKTPNELALSAFLSVLTLIFVLVVLTLVPMANYSNAQQPITVLIALLVCLIPTTIGALLSAIGIAGMDRLIKRNVLATSGKAVEAAGDVTTLLLDKTGTITVGNRKATAFVAAEGISEIELARKAQLSSLADETPEGRSIVVLAQDGLGLGEVPEADYAQAEFIPFSAETRMSGVKLSENHQVVKGAATEMVKWVEKSGVQVGDDVKHTIERISNDGGTALVVAEEDKGKRQVLGTIHLKDIIKEGMVERFKTLRSMGIRTVMITGDNELTAQAIAREAGVDDYLAQAKPEDKLALIRREQKGGNMVAMTGDGTNDAPALAQADVGVAMNTGTQAAKEAGNMVDLDSDPTKLIEIVEIGKQLLITRGALTTFSIANDIAKYFAIVPAMFVVAFPGLDVLNIMRLSSPESAITSAVIFNAIIIVLLIPLALRGVKYVPGTSHQLLRRNLVVYGLGGFVVPFIGIKIIDMIVSLLPGF
ncbi:potassium-transporting ATPase subunit KdpB [Brevibacterium sp. UMB1308A]|uniref:potassium-transporting ATPase subunit KdpB n=1 Tax=Brevibacterium sp. UMB1308A TaxID=3050608 RepID=UPI00254C609E|nr:potassium-transporting ATPase subunit KdpB [Brevibacterium sp. UMB1308A]MDK8346185.1 potassium-transporting ATPase subunit KdpB [Brevibacterium sp. UMB1308B]MDK8712381.1 potassium-transporting ATPase subunit KdpB [Brevibacterium sp. UMB1308A]